VVDELLMQRQLKPNVIWDSVWRFHTEEHGIEAIQSVMLLGAAAVALIAIRNQWNNIVAFFRRNAELAINWSP